MRAYDRLLRYVTADTQSNEKARITPSTEKQFRLARLLYREMKALGMERVHLDENCYTYGFLPASPGMEKEPVIGFIAHIDTAPDYSGAAVKPSLCLRYDGREIPLGESGLVLRPADFPDLYGCIGHTLIITDGTTLLGADDKAGAAEIMTACERLIRDRRPHGGVSVCFTPDEEIGHGAALLDLERFGADFAYTVDGGAVEEINFETFNAAAAHFRIRGVSVHPGSAKGIMVNAAHIAARINAMLPPDEIPSKTEGYEGYYHLMEIKGNVSSAEMKYIIRDHDRDSYHARCLRLREIERLMNEEYGSGTVTLDLQEQYRNMEEILSDHMEIVERAEKAIHRAGLEPVTVPVRGGTDGAWLSFHGLPCPNLGTGGAGFHGPYEHISVENMDKAVEILLNIMGPQE